MKNTICPKYFLFWLVILFFFYCLMPAEAQTYTIDADHQLNYADHLFNAHEYALAIDEFKRFLYFFPGDSRIFQTRYKIGLAYLKSGRYKAAAHAFEGLTENFVQNKLTGPIYFSLSESYLNQNNTDKALITLHNLVTISKDRQILDHANYKIALIYLEIGMWEKAGTFLAKISLPNQERYQLKRISKELEQSSLIRHKSPGLAGLLSIIPGGGYLYCERYQDALTAFVVNCGLIYAAYEAFDNKLYGIGGMISFVEFGFYSGNIYGAMTSAHKFNASRTKRFIDNLKKNLSLNLACDSTMQTLGLTMQYSF